MCERALKRATVYCSVHGAFCRPIQRDPTVRGEVLEHRNHELQTAVPMGQENDQGDQIQDAHHHTGDGQELEGGEKEEDEDREMKTMRRSSTK